jgi:hypothetical protein
MRCGFCAICQNDAEILSEYPSAQIRKALRIGGQNDSVDGEWLIEMENYVTLSS